MNPLVSIITPTYNHQEYIADCIDSVQAQKYTNWEMIIVDDGSTDKTFEIASQFAKYDSRIKVFTQKNIGPFRLGETYNFALQQSKGKYIAILEGDDLWLEDKLTVQVEALEKNTQAVLCWGKVNAVNRDNSKILQMQSWNFNHHKKYPHSDTGKIDLMIYMRCMMPALTVIVKKDVLSKIGGFVSVSNLPLIDVPTWISLALHGKFIFIEQLLGRWRMYPE